MAKKSNDKTLSVLTHVLALITGFVAPLIIFLASEDKQVKKHAKLALNWQFSLLIYLVGAFILIFVLIGFILFPVLIVVNLIFCIIAAVKASEDEFYEYPLSIKFFKI